MRWLIIILCSLVIIAILGYLGRSLQNQQIIDLTDAERQTLIDNAAQHLSSNPTVDYGQLSKPLNQILSDSILRQDQSIPISFTDIDWAYTVYPQGSHVYGIKFMGLENCLPPAQRLIPLGTTPEFKKIDEDKNCSQWWTINVSIDQLSTILATRASETGLDISL